MNTKTIEEIKAAVLAECIHRLAMPAALSEDALDVRRVDVGEIHYYLERGPESFRRCIHRVTPNASAGQTEDAYRLLGLEARDAVEAERENYKALEALLIQRNEQINAERAHAAKLVEALEEIRKPAMIIGFGKKATGKIRAQQLEEDHVRVRTIAKEALAAHKKGGAQG